MLMHLCWILLCVYWDTVYCVYFHHHDIPCNFSLGTALRNVRSIARDRAQNLTINCENWVFHIFSRCKDHHPMGGQDATGKLAGQGKRKEKKRKQETLWFWMWGREKLALTGLNATAFRHPRRAHVYLTHAAQFSSGINVYTDVACRP